MKCLKSLGWIFFIAIKFQFNSKSYTRIYVASKLANKIEIETVVISFCFCFFSTAFIMNSWHQQIQLRKYNDIESGFRVFILFLFGHKQEDFHFSKHLINQRYALFILFESFSSNGFYASILRLKNRILKIYLWIYSKCKIHLI